MEPPRDVDLRNFLRFAGPVMVGVGLLLFLGAMLQIHSREIPNPVLPFLGVLLFGAGGAITRWAWMGPAAAYAAQETAPAVAITTRAVLGEVRGGAAPTCLKCGVANAPDARFCKSCGQALAQACAHCGGANAADARFCDDCGKPMRA